MKAVVAFCGIKGRQVKFFFAFLRDHAVFVCERRMWSGDLGVENLHVAVRSAAEDLLAYLLSPVAQNP